MKPSYLVGQGVEINPLSPLEANSPLAAALSNTDQQAAVPALLAHGANPCYRDTYSRDILEPLRRDGKMDRLKENAVVKQIEALIKNCPRS